MLSEKGKDKKRRQKVYQKKRKQKKYQETKVHVYRQHGHH